MENGRTMVLHSVILGLLLYLVMIFVLGQTPRVAENRSILLAAVILIYMILFGHGLPTHINKNNKLDLSDPTCLSIEKYLESPEIMVYKDDVLIVQRGTIGKIVLIENEIGEATINPSMLILRSKNVLSKYI
mgnify:CR=1 FL=1